MTDDSVRRGTSDPRRFLRQVLLAEIGAQGQARIEASSAAVLGPGPRLACEVASRYAHAAGFASLTEGPIDLEGLAPSAIVVDEAARDVLAGARAALAAIRAATSPRSSPTAADRHVEPLK